MNWLLIMCSITYSLHYFCNTIIMYDFDLLTGCTIHGLPRNIYSFENYDLLYIYKLKSNLLITNITF